MEPGPIVAREVATERLVLVCGKCTRKLKGGFGRKRKDSLRSILRDALKAAGLRRSLRVVETGCLGLCPRDAATIADSARPGVLLSVPAGTKAASVLDRLAPGVASPI